jgi:hypothetical protein
MWGVDGVLEELDREAKELNISRQAVIKTLIRRALDEKYVAVPGRVRKYRTSGLAGWVEERNPRWSNVIGHWLYLTHILNIESKHFVWRTLELPNSDERS